MRILTIIFASLFLIFRYCTMEPNQYEFVTIKNNIDIAILATINTQEPLDSLYRTLNGVVVSPHDTDALLLTYKRNTFLKKYNKFAINILPLYIAESYPTDSINKYPDKYGLKSYQYTKSELEALNWTITYP